MRELQWLCGENSGHWMLKKKKDYGYFVGGITETQEQYQCVDSDNYRSATTEECG